VCESHRQCQHQHPPAHLLPHPTQLQRPSKSAASDSEGKAATVGENRSRMYCLWRSGGRALCVNRTASASTTTTTSTNSSSSIFPPWPYPLPYQGAHQQLPHSLLSSAPLPTPLPAAPPLPPTDPTSWLVQLRSTCQRPCGLLLASCSGTQCPKRTQCIAQQQQ
jgi:hypothetical protein